MNAAEKRDQREQRARERAEKIARAAALRSQAQEIVSGGPPPEWQRWGIEQTRAWKRAHARLLTAARGNLSADATAARLAAMREALNFDPAAER